MVRTKKQQHGDFVELMNKVEDLTNDYEIEETKMNNKGYDYKRKKRNYGRFVLTAKKKDDGEYVESKGGSSKQTKAQKEFQKEVEKVGKKYVVKRKTGYEDVFEEFND